MIENLELKFQNFKEDRELWINGRAVSGVEVRSSTYPEEYYLVQPIVLEGTVKGKKYYFVVRVTQNNYYDLNDDAIGAVVFRSRGYNDIIPTWADNDTKFAGIPLKQIERIDRTDTARLFYSEEDWEEAFQETIEDADPDEDKEYIDNQRDDFFSSAFNLWKQDPDSFVFLDLYDHGGHVWNAHGAGPQCRWDTTQAAAVLLLDEFRTKQYKEDPKTFWEVFNWYMSRMSGEPTAAIEWIVCVDADTYTVVEDMGDYSVYTLNALMSDIEDEETAKEVAEALEYLIDADDVKFVTDIEFKPRSITLI